MQTTRATVPVSTLSINVMLVVAVLVLHLLVLGALPTAMPPLAGWAMVILLALFSSALHWGLIHEAIHKLLFSGTESNEYGGRLLGVLMGASFHVLRFGHLMHHQLNRQWHSERVPERTPLVLLDYYAHLFFGLYLSEVLTSLTMALLPRRLFMALARVTLLRGYEDVAVAGERFFYRRGHIRAVRIDMAAFLLLYGGAFWLYAADWPMLLGFVATRALVISFLDNIYHYATPLDNSKAGKELALPRWAARAVLNSNYHETHHTQPDVAWHALPQAHAANARRFDGPWLAHARLQLYGPII